MKYLKSYRLFEYVKSDNRASFYIYSIKKELSVFNIENFNIDKDSYTYSFGFSLIGDKDLKDILRILNKYKEKASRELLQLSYDYTKNNTTVLDNEIEKLISYYVFDIHIKESYIFRVKPNQFVYHISPTENREDILINGLQPKPMTNHRGSYLEYKPAIFANNSSKKRDWFYMDLNGYDVWKIDTTKINNKWWYDLNMYNIENEKPAYKMLNKRYIMTYESIPPDAIELADKRFIHI